MPPPGREYEMRCPKCGGDEIYVPASCFVAVSRLDDEGHLRIFPSIVMRVETDFDGELRCGNPKCFARFWDSALKFETPLAPRHSGNP